MHPNLQQLMQEATRLTRQGDLQAATGLLQAALNGRAGHDDGDHGGDVIDVEAREVPTQQDAGLLGTSVPRPETPRSTPTSEEAFIAGRLGGPGAAGRDYKLYVPPGAGQRPLPLVVMLHGCTQDADDFAAGTNMNAQARMHGFYVLYPVQSKSVNPQKCWNWFKHTHQQRGRGEPALLVGMVREVMARHAVDPARVFVAGLSAGGAMAAIVGQAYPDLFAGIGVHSGLPAGAARDLPSALEAMKKGPARAAPVPARPPTIVFHGDNDKTVHPANGEQVFGLGNLTGSGIESETVERPSRRRSTRRVVRDTTGKVVAEHWLVHGSPHAWSGGSTRGSYTDPQGPDATAEMLRFFGIAR